MTGPFLPSRMDVADDAVSAAEVLGQGARLGPDGHPSDYRCDQCGNVFFPRNVGARFCEPRCAIDGWQPYRDEKRGER